MDAAAGFLPPDDATGRGEGHISFSVMLRAGITDGQRISNTAVVVFDTNPPIPTNQVWNTVRYSPSITSFAPVSGTAGATVTITGFHFTGATAVLFNGTPAIFSVISSTQITATVPALATTGPISVTTPGGTTVSNSSFVVLLVRRYRLYLPLVDR